MFKARLQEFPFTAVVSENVFCQGMVALINISCGFLSGKRYVHKSEVLDAVFDDLQNTLLDPAIENRRIVWTCNFGAAGSKAEGSISYNYRFHIVTRCKSELQITNVIYSQCLR